MKNIEFINAGAGSGKTYTLTAKLASLIEKGETSPSRVILSTFTNRAADEFRVKARAMLVSKGLHEKAAEMDSAVIGTVHSVALGYIQKYWYLLGLGADVQAMPEEDAARYINTTLYKVATQEEIAVFNRYAESVPLKITKSSKFDYDYWKEDMKKMVEDAETFGLKGFDNSLAESLKLHDDLFHDEPEGELKSLRLDVIRQMFRIAGRWKDEFNRYKKERNLISYNDMERLFLELLDNPQVREDISLGVDYVFVDEFQDSNPTQVKIFDKLSDIVAKGSFWVGDPKQAIYDFRGCDTQLTTTVAGIIESGAKAGEHGFKYSVLRKSFRSDPALVELANKVFVPVFSSVLTKDKVALDPNNTPVIPSDVPRIYQWNMIPGVTATGRPSYSADNAKETVAANIYAILHGDTRIKEVVDKDSGKLRPVRPSDIAVLCKRNTEVQEIASTLRDMGVPVMTEVETGAGSIELAFVCAVLNYLMGSTNLLEAELASMIDGLRVEDLLEHPNDVGKRELFTRLDTIKESMVGMPVSHVVSSVIDMLDMERRAYMWGEGVMRMTTLESVKAMAASYESQCIGRGDAATLAGFVNMLSTVGVTSEREAQMEGVNVLTYHASKGLEWNVVILYSLSDDEIGDTKKFFFRNYFGVNHRRLTNPSPDNPYSEFILRYVPRIGAGNAKLPDYVNVRLGSRTDRYSIEEEIRSEISRLLYVGVTRARDYLVSFAVKPDNMCWLKNVGIVPVGCEDLNGGMGSAWGTGMPKAFVERVGQCLPVTDPDGIAKDYLSLSLPGTVTERSEKYLSPSSMKYEGDDVRFEPVRFHDGQPGRITVMPLKDVGANILGTCIHNIFAAYREGDAEWNRALAERTVSAYGLSSILTEPETILKAADSLFAYLKEMYGSTDSALRELPFSFRRPATGQVVTGEMDLLLPTVEGDVLVDYKNYPGYDDILDPNSEFYVGKYAGQMKGYKEALESAGRKVREILVYYSVQGRLVRMVED